MPILFLFLFLLPLPALAETIYAVVLGNQGHVVGSSTLESGLFRSTDRGNSWVQLGPRNLKAYAMDLVRAEKGRILYIAAGNGVHRSLDSGQTWKIVTDWRVTEVLDVAVDQDDPRYVYAGTAFGLWFSEDGGDTWQQSMGELESTYIYQLSINPTFNWPPRGKRRALSVMTDYRQKPSWRIVADSGSVRPNLVSGTDRLPDDTAGPCFWWDVYDWFLYNPGYRSNTHHVIFTDGNRVMQGTERLGGISVPCEPAALPLGEPLPHPVHALLLLHGSGYRDPILAGTFGDGVWRIEGDGEWERVGLEGGQVWGLVRSE